MSVDVSNGVAQERRLVTEIPGPRSQALQARKTGAVSAGVGVTLFGLAATGWGVSASRCPSAAGRRLRVD